MERRMATIVQDEVGEALKHTALVLAGTILMATVAVATTWNALAIRLENRIGSASSRRGEHA